MQGQAAGHRPSHQRRYSTTSEGHRSGGSSPFHSPGMGPHPTLGGPLHSTQLGFRPQMSSGNVRQHQAGQLLEADLADVAVAQQFPPAQRLFLLFLQAADSHRLDASLLRYREVFSSLQSFTTVHSHRLSLVCLYRRYGWLPNSTSRQLLPACIALCTASKCSTLVLFCVGIQRLAYVDKVLQTTQKHLQVSVQAAALACSHLF